MGLLNSDGVPRRAPEQNGVFLRSRRGEGGARRLGWPGRARWLAALLTAALALVAVGCADIEVEPFELDDAVERVGVVVSGVDFHEFEGRHLHLFYERIEERREVTILGGRWTAEFGRTPREALEPIAVLSYFIDTNQDGRCSDGDDRVGEFRAPVTVHEGVAVVLVERGDRPPPPMPCASFPPPQEP